MNTDSITTRKVAFGADGGIERPGDFCFDEDFSTIYVWLPGCSGPDAIRINKGPQGGARVWGWDGNEDKPTLSPSLSCPEWHGYLRAGRLESC